MKRASSEASPAAKKPKQGDALAILASISDANTEDLSTANKFTFKDKKEGGGDTLTLKASPNCFAGLTFVFSGVFTNYDRTNLENFSKDHGAKVTSSISGKTSALIVGDSDVGPSKLSKAKEKGIKILNESGFLELVEQMPEGGGNGAAAEKARQKQEADALDAQKKAAELKSQHFKQEDDVETDLWTTKYAPKDLGDVCGNPGMVRKLSTWLANWKKYQKGGFKPGMGDGSEFRAAMLHGAPGIGKTTAAHLVANLAGYDVIEYNASDTRSKKLLQEHVQSTLSNTSLAGFMGKSRTQKPICIIMDEVDGMSAGDRGGVGQMAQFAKKTNVPLILICNERTLPKMRPFDKCCLELAFRRPDASSIRKRLVSIAMAENLEIDATTIDQLVAQTRSDIRQILNLLSTYTTTHKSMSSAEGAKFAKTWQKESALKPFDIVQKYLSPQIWRDNSNIDSKIEYYFNDYAFAPLMVQENYLNTAPSTGDHLKQVLKAAESISDADMVDRFIHGSEPQWSLMPLHAILSCVKPSFYINGRTTGMLAFSAWLGNNSKAGKYRRLLNELESHVRLRLWAGTYTLRSEFMMDFVEMLLTPLKTSGQDAIAQVIEVMDAYYMTREDFDVVMELPVGKETPEKIYKMIPTAVKTAFTRKYNSMGHPVPFMKFVDTKTATKKEALPDLDDVVDNDMEAEPEKEETTLESEIAKDKYIKAQKPKAKKAAPKKAAAPKKPTKAKK